MAKETISRTTLAKGITAGVIAAASLGILTIGEYTLDTGSDSDVSEVGSGNVAVDFSACTPGTYTASCAGISSDVTVSLTVDETGIKEITADVSGETAGIGADIGDEMSEKVLSAQSADVDGVAGATVTSDAFKAAAADCIAQATGGGSDDAAATEAETDEANASDTEEETEAAGDNSEEETADTGSASDGETEAGDGKTDAGALSGELQAGTYTASAAGISSNVPVTITVDEDGTIASVTTDVSGETAGIGADIGDEMAEKALEAQSADIDGVAGATVTSDAFKSALDECLTLAAAGETGGESSADVEAETEADTENTKRETEAVEAKTEAAEEETGAAELGAEAAESETEAAETATEAVEEDFSGAASEGLTPGAYTASAAGISSDVTVTITVDDEGGITSISADVSGETPEIGGAIGDEMIEKALEAQSADIDGVSGATITSDAFKSALAECLSFASAADTEEAAEESEISDEETESADDSGTVATTDGDPNTFTASAQGISSDVTVTITVDEDGAIASISADVSGETPEIGGAIGDELIEKALEAQSAVIDGVSGATVTSDAFKAALAECLDLVIAGAVEDTQETDLDETELTEASYLTLETEEALAESPEGPFIPGTYTATAAGIDSDVTVSITFDEAAIVDIDVDVSGETAGIGAMIDGEMIRQILAAQSSDVDGVSGATVTSDAVKAAAGDCISQARAGIGDETETETETGSGLS